MAQAFSSLTVYRLRKDGLVSEFKDFIDPKKKASRHQLKARFDFDAELFVAPADEKPPNWLEPLKTGAVNATAPQFRVNWRASKAAEEITFNIEMCDQSASAFSRWFRRRSYYRHFEVAQDQASHLCHVLDKLR